MLSYRAGIRIVDFRCAEDIVRDARPFLETQFFTILHICFQCLQIVH